MNMRSLASIFLLTLVTIHFAWAGSQFTTYQAKIIKPDGEALEASNVNFKFTVLNPAANCILYSESYSAINMANTGGLVSFSLGSGIKSYPTSSTTFADVFDNSGAAFSCDAGGPTNYQPTASDVRKIIMQFNDGNGWQTLPAMSINAVPYAMYSTDALHLGGVSATSYVKYSTIPTCAASESLSYNGASFSCITAGAAPVNVTSSTVVTALGFTPVDGATVSATILSLQNSVTASFAAIASSTSPAYTGDVTKAAASNTLTLSNSGVTSGTYTKVTVDAKGRVTTGTNPTTLSGFGITDAIKNAGGVGAISSGLDASKPGSPANGDLFVATDAQKIYQYNSGSWNVVITGGGSVSNLDASVITTGSVSAARLPTASATSDGIINQIAQSIKGIKTFIDDVILQGKLTVAGDIIAHQVIYSNSSATCNASIEGAQRYNSTSKAMEFCNGTSWNLISPPLNSSMRLSYGNGITGGMWGTNITFTVNYNTGTEVSTITLSASHVALGGTTSAGCHINGVYPDGSNALVYYISVDGCTGTGTVNVSIASGTAKSLTGQDTLAAGPSPDALVDNSGPLPPTSITLGAVSTTSLALMQTPTITYNAAVDVGYSTIYYYQVKVTKTSDSSVIQDWNGHVSGTAMTGLPLQPNTQYSVFVRAADNQGNIGASSVAYNFTTPAGVDCISGSPTPGALCSNGTIYVGSLSPGAASGTGTDRYMTTPGGCGEIPLAQQGGGSGITTYPNGTFTPTCGGVDTLRRSFDDNQGTATLDVPGLTPTYDFNTDPRYGSENTANLSAVHDASHGGYHAAALYCENLSYGGYTDWFLPNGRELKLLMDNHDVVAGVTSSDYYWSSTTARNDFAWYGYAANSSMTYSWQIYGYYVRCMRRY